MVTKLAASTPFVLHQATSHATEKEIRSAIAVLVKMSYAEPTRDDWTQIARDLSRQLRVDYRIVRGVLEKLSAGVPADKRRAGGGRKHRIIPGTAKADVLVGSLRCGFGSRHTATFINELGVSPSKKPIHKTTVARTAKRQFGMVCSKRKTTKTGSRDVESKWAVSRLAICLQFANDLATRTRELEGTLFVDEHSEYCILGDKGHHGQANHHEWRAPMKDGKYCDAAGGGVLEPQIPYRKPKNPARADGIFGVCAPTPLGGRRREGRRMAPCRYRGKVIGMAAYEKALLAEFERVRALGRNAREKGTRSVWLDHIHTINPYEARFGNEWRAHLPGSFAITSIQVLVDHVIAEGNRLFSDTRFAGTWSIYHDALPQWWEQRTQEYIRERGFADRQWRANDDTDLLIAGHYRGKLMGDSPELMPLDSSLFSDLIEKVAWLVVSTAALVEEKYSMATPNEAWRTMVAAWTQVPEKRIVDDIDRFAVALGAIITAKGAYVSDCDLRNGHRRLMQRLVRGRTRAEDGGCESITERLNKGLEEVKKSWAGMTENLSAPE